MGKLFFLKARVQFFSHQIRGVFLQGLCTWLQSVLRAFSAQQSGE